MALPPSIPTSFVPHTPSTGHALRSGLTGVFGYFAYGLLSLMVVAALGVFFYGRVLAASKASHDAELAAAEAAIDATTVQSFLQLHDRLNSAKTLLQSHIAFSGFFRVLTTIMPKNVRLASLHIALDPVSGTKVEGTGVAASFNALSAASEAFATDGRIKDVIFSKMSINKNQSVSFNLSAKLDPSIIAYTPGLAPSASAEVLPDASAATTTTNL